MTQKTQALSKPWILLLLLYLPLCIFALNQEWGFDFSSYYLASNTLMHGGAPYQHGETTFLVWNHLNVPANPNPPITLLLFYAFAYFSYPIAFFLWLICSTTLGAIGLYQVLACIAPATIQTGEYKKCLFVYMASFPIIMNTIMLQFGGVLLFLLAMGYSHYLKKQTHWTSFWWGLLIAIKLFPGLLIVYTLLKKQYRLTVWLIGWVMCLSLLPMLPLGKVLYMSYLHAIFTKIFWYGVNWNMSILGFLYRVLVTVIKEPLIKNYIPTHGVLLAECLYLLFSTLAFLHYLAVFKRLDRVPHKSFACLLILMLLISPFGWLYYAPLLCIPLLCTLNDVQTDPARFSLWLLTLYCLYFPIPVIHAIAMTSALTKIGLFSIHFYALLGLGYLTYTLKTDPKTFTIAHFPTSLTPWIKMVLGFSIGFVALRGLTFLIRLGLGKITWTFLG